MGIIVPQEAAGVRFSCTWNAEGLPHQTRCCLKLWGQGVWGIMRGMLDLQWMRLNLDQVEQGVRSKKVPFDRPGFESLDQRRREVIARTEQLRAEKKALSKEIGRARSPLRV